MFGQAESRRGPATGDDSGAEMVLVESTGRWRPDFSDPFVMGYDFYHLNINSGDSMLPPRLIDQSVVVALPIGEWDQWQVDLSVGGGYAGNNPFGDDDGFYGRANLSLRAPWSGNSELILLVNYDGNRAIFPDVPLPAVMWRVTPSPQLTYVLGFPISSIHWQVTDKLRLDVRYSAPFGLTGVVDYEVLDWMHVFGQISSAYRGFCIGGDADNRRVFFQQRRVEGGIRLLTHSAVEMVIAGGLAFDQELERGFDVRDTDTVRKFSNEPYLKVRSPIRFLICRDKTACSLHPSLR